MAQQPEPLILNDCSMGLDAGYVIAVPMRHRRRHHTAGLLPVAVTGVYGFIAVNYLETA